jgi:hypothetical protein
VKRAGWSLGAAGALVLGGGVAACAALSGLDTFGACGGDCDASSGAGNHDVSTVVPMDSSQTTPPEDQASPEEAGPPGDDGDEAGDANENPDVEMTTGGDSGADVEAPPDSGPAAEGGTTHDAGAGDGGCESTDTIQHCSACGVACNTSTGTPMCNGFSCSYSCASNKVDCNGGTAPDSDGCECAGTACCGPSCETAHESGIPSPATYYNCSATGNNNQIEATAVCLGVGGTGCANQTASCGGILGFGGTTTNAVCGTVSNTCYCWVYSGQNSGTVASVMYGQCNNIPCQSGQPWN